MIYRELLESKWGTFEEIGHSLVNGKMPFVSDVARLNMLFPASDHDSIINEIYEKYQCKLPDQLLEFYLKFNGCRLFFGSLNIFGIQKYPNEIYQPFDLFVENNHILGKTRKESNIMLFFASIGGDYAFGFDTLNPNKIIGIKKNSSFTTVQEFADFKSFFNFHFNRLIKEYDSDCRKIHPSKEFIGIPALENLSSELT